MTTPTTTDTRTARLQAADAAQNGDLLGCAVILARAGLDWSHVDLTVEERAEVEQATARR